MKRNITLTSISVYLSLFTFVMRQVGLLSRYANILLPILVISAFLLACSWDPEPIARLLTNLTQNDTLSKWIVKLGPVENR